MNKENELNLERWSGSETRKDGKTRSKSGKNNGKRSETQSLFGVSGLPDRRKCIIEDYDKELIK